MRAWLLTLTGWLAGAIQLRPAAGELESATDAAKPSSPKYAGFLSYSHTDRDLAAILQEELEVFGKKRGDVRARQIFRDDSNLPAGGTLPDRLQGALSQSEFLILLASPEAAASYWVQQELAFFLSQRPLACLIILLTGGNIEWNRVEDRLIRGVENALPETLLLQGEPLYLDFRPWRAAPAKARRSSEFQDAIATIVATLSGNDKDLLIRAHVAEYQRERRRLQIHLAIRGAIGAGLGGAASLALLFSQQVTWLWLPAAAISAGALSALLAGCGLRGAAAFGGSFALAGLAVTLHGATPFTSISVDTLILFWLCSTLFYLSGVLGAILSRSAPAARCGIWFFLVGLLFTGVVKGGLFFFALLIAAGVSDITGTELLMALPGLLSLFVVEPLAQFPAPLFATPWFGDRIRLAFTAVRGVTTDRPDAGAYMLPILVFLVILGAVVGFERASSELPPRDQRMDRRLLSLIHKAVLVLLFASAVGIGIWDGINSSRHAQVVRLTALLSAPGLRQAFDKGVFGSYTDDRLRLRNYGTYMRTHEVFATAIRARNLLQKIGRVPEARALDALIAEWVDDYVKAKSGSSTAFERFDAIAVVLLQQAAKHELENLFDAAFQSAGGDPKALREVARAAFAVRPKLDRVEEACERLYAQRSLFRTASDFGEAAVIFHQAGRSAEATHMLAEGLERIRADHASLPGPHIGFEREAAAWAWDSGALDRLPDWKYDHVEIAPVVLAMAKRNRWDAAIKLAQRDRYSGGFEKAMLDLVRLACDRCDLERAFALEEALAKRSLADGWRRGERERQQSLEIIGSSACFRALRSFGWGTRFRQRLLPPPGGPTSQAIGYPLATVLLGLGDDVEDLPGFSTMGSRERAQLLIEAAARDRMRGRTTRADQRLRRAWKELSINVEPSACEQILGVASELAAQGDLLGARNVADQCVSPSGSYYWTIGRILAGWYGKCPKMSRAGLDAAIWP